ncbi:AP2-associated kinase [Pseudohyphozyma bogoriensis]|nr:AP2-associated kinase [Pseudohyphozyma bogoriensis]
MAYPYSPSQGPSRHNPAASPHYASSPAPHHQPPPHKGTLVPGSVIQVGQYTVTVDRFLSEGGFAHVYLATSDTPIPAGSPTATTKHVLKRMAVPNKAGVQEIGKEVEVMKKLKGHQKIVNFIEASVSELPASSGMKGYEIFILMEWCAGGGIIDMMNTRLQNRLTETEILKIFSDTVEAVAHMHYQNPPLIHRDLKVENILLSPPQTFKLCDFGSTTTPLTKVPTAANELQAIEAEINKTTTLQYRAPELVDVWSRRGYDEKIDIWALGVFLYKLCYYTTPFEEHGPLAILSAQYKIPPYPAYSNAIKGIIGGMLQERASQRPNIYQVHEQVCRLRGTSIKLENKYANQATSSGPSSQSSYPNKGASSNYSSIISSSPAPPMATTPDLSKTISPMRRGRPVKPAAPEAEPAPVPTQADNRMVRTGLASQGEWERGAWDIPSAGTGETASLGVPARPHGGASSAPITAVSSGTSNGFGDSFVTSPFPTSFQPLASPTLPSSGSPPPTVPSPAVTTTMFSDLVPQSQSPMPTSSDAKDGLAGSKLGSEWSPAPSPSPALVRPTSATSPGSASFSSAYGGLQLDSKTPLPASFGGTPSVLSPAISAGPPPAAARSPAPQLTGEEPPALPRRPPGNRASVQAPSPSPASSWSNKPELVNRGSQTSPHLLATWRARDSQATTPSSTVYPSFSSSWSSRPPGPSLPPETTSPAPSATSPSLPPAASPSAAPVTQSKRPPIDLLGDDDDFAPSQVSQLPPSSISLSTGPSKSFDSPVAPTERQKFRPTRPSEVPPPMLSERVPDRAPALNTSTSTISDAKERFPELDAESRFPALDDFAPSQLPPSRAAPEEEKWKPIVEKEEASSDEEVVVEDFEPTKRYGASSVASNGSSAGPPPPPPPKPSSIGRQPSIRSPTQAPVQSPPQHASSLPPIQRVSSSDLEGEGDIDLGPALASIHKFAPKGNANAAPHPSAPANDDDDEWAPPPKSSSSWQSPVLQAPKPQQVHRGDGGINTLVSRYETLSTDADVSGRTSADVKQPPPPTAKPASLRRSSAISGSSRGGTPSSPKRGGAAGHRNREFTMHWASPKASVDGFQSRFPDSAGLDNHFASTNSPEPPRSPAAAAPASPRVFGQPASPRSTGSYAGTGVPADRPRFKPTPPSTTSSPSFTGGSVGRALPPLPSSATGASSSSRGGSQKQDEPEEEERFAGVANMKSRWESMSKGKGSGPGNVGKPRLESAVI